MSACSGTRLAQLNGTECEDAKATVQRHLSLSAGWRRGGDHVFVRASGGALSKSTPSQGIPVTAQCFAKADANCYQELLERLDLAVLRRRLTTLTGYRLA
jgi:hypothetical protein